MIKMGIWTFFLKSKNYLNGKLIVQFSSVHFSCSVMSDSLQPHELQHARPPCPSPTPGGHPNSCASSRWCHPTISSSVVPFFSYLQSFPASGEWVSQFFISGDQTIGVSASASVLPVSIQDWFPLGWTGWISMQMILGSCLFSSVQSFSHVRLFATPWTADTRPPCPSSTPGVYSNSCPLSWWCHPNISSFVIPFSSHLQSFPESGSFQMS